MLDTVIVRIAQGDLRGCKNVTKSGGNMFTFLSVPYARPPVHELRFKPPQPPKCWSGVRDALEWAPVCLQEDFITRSIIGQEDCLYLNVYTSQLPSKSKSSPKSVMVWIHGGGFTGGSGNRDIYSPDYLVDADVVVVTINYRLGVLGFLSLDNNIAPGNLGLKDQIAALKWVQENIGAFGGDPSNVTIFGESAGGASVHYLMLSKLSKGLFHKATAQSGSALNPWAFSFTNKDRAFKLGECLGCKTSDTEILFNFLMEQDAYNIVKASMKLIPKNENMTGIKFPFIPTVEPNVEGALLTEHPMSALKLGHFQNVPFITGVTSHEGIISLRSVGSSKWDDVNKTLEENLPEKVRGSAVPLGYVTRQIRDLYFKNEPLTNNTVSQYVEYQSDINFVEGVYTTVKHIVALSSQPVFLYTFQFEGSLGLSKMFVNTDVKGTCHADDLGYLFTSALLDINVDPSSPEMKTIKRMVTMWTNFAKYGNPTPHLDDNISVYWKPCTIKNISVLTIDKDLTCDQKIVSKHLSFWEDLYHSKL